MGQALEDGTSWLEGCLPSSITLPNSQGSAWPCELHGHHMGSTPKDIPDFHPSAVLEEKHKQGLRYSLM